MNIIESNTVKNSIRMALHSKNLKREERNLTQVILKGVMLAKEAAKYKNIYVALKAYRGYTNRSLFFREKWLYFWCEKNEFIKDIKRTNSGSNRCRSRFNTLLEKLFCQ